ncbi:MAG: fused MFS/spermidine synthase [bacterium]|nr:fused MFS/spermidine synthase [bacterium]
MHLRLKKQITAYRYELIALLTGATVMMLEIVGARLIAPYFGTSIYVWTAMIGVILGALSIGFWYGGKLADRDDSKNDMTLIIIIAAALIFLATIVQDFVLESLANQRFDLRVSSFLAASILFAPPSLLIGMVSPHLAKIRITSLETTGATIGRLEAAGAIGSIIGTFLSGYVLLSFFGARTLSLLLVVVLVITSLLANRRRLLWPRIILVFLALIAAYGNPLPRDVVADIDSSYSRYQVKQTLYNGRQANLLVMDGTSYQSGAYLDGTNEPVFSYIRAMYESAINYNSPKNILVIGGGAYTLPMVLAEALPDSQVDVVEIDPVMDEIASNYFGFEKLSNINIYHEDGRRYLNRHSEAYDLIFLDAFSSLTPPFHLTSREAVERIKKNLNPQGAVVVNVPGDYYGQLVGSIKQTYKSVFSHSSVYRANPNLSLEPRQNFLLVASSSMDPLVSATSELGESVPFATKGFVLTDDYAPVERLSF